MWKQCSVQELAQNSEKRQLAASSLSVRPSEQVGFLWADFHEFRYLGKKNFVKWSRYRPGVAQRVGRGIALLFHDRGTRRGWVVSSTPRPQFTPGKDPVPILQEAGWAPGPVWTGGKSGPHRDSIPDRPARSQLLYRLSYRDHKYIYIVIKMCETFVFSKISVYVERC